MTKFLKIAAIAAFMLASIAGCTTAYDNDKIEQKTIIQSSSFNEEHYIWESFLFPTNRTTGR